MSINCWSNIPTRTNKFERFVPDGSNRVIAIFQKTVQILTVDSQGNILVEQMERPSAPASDDAPTVSDFGLGFHAGYEKAREKASQLADPDKAADDWVKKNPIAEVAARNPEMVEQLGLTDVIRKNAETKATLDNAKRQPLTSHIDNSTDPVPVEAQPDILTKSERKAYVSAANAVLAYFKKSDCLQCRRGQCDAAVEADEAGDKAVKRYKLWIARFHADEKRKQASKRSRKKASQ